MDIIGLISQLPSWFTTCFSAVGGYFLAKITLYFKGSKDIIDSLVGKKAYYINLALMYIFLIVIIVILVVSFQPSLTRVIDKQFGYKKTEVRVVYKFGKLYVQSPNTLVIKSNVPVLNQYKLTSEALLEYNIK